MERLENAAFTGAERKAVLEQTTFGRASLRGPRVLFERRLFVTGGQKELVYFRALFGGKPLPYRLDQYLAWGATKPQEEGAFRHLGSRLADSKLWGMAWNSFLNRTACGGSQQFIRISTPVHGQDLASADKLLQEFLPLWLKPVAFEAELEQWARANGQGRGGKGKEVREERGAGVQQ